MKHAIVLTLLALLAPAYAATRASDLPAPSERAAPAPSSHATADDTRAEPAAAGDPSVCNEMFTLCTTECKADFGGSALGACLRLCRLEQKECLAGH